MINLSQLNRMILSQHLVNVVIKSVLSFLPFIIYLVFFEQVDEDFNTFSFYFSIFNIIYGLFGLPIYHYLLNTTSSLSLYRYFNHNSRFVRRFRILLFLLTLFFFYNHNTLLVVVLSAILYSHIFSASAIKTRQNKIGLEVSVNFAFFAPFIVTLCVYGFDPYIAFTAGAGVLTIISTTSFAKLTWDVSVARNKVTTLEMLEVTKYVALSGLGSVISYGDIVVAVEYLSSSDAYAYIWINRGILGSTILCIGLSNYILANEKLSKIFIIFAFMISVFMSIICYIILQYFFKFTFHFFIYIVISLIITIKYMNVFPSITLMKNSRTHFRIWSTIIAALAYVSLLLLFNQFYVYELRALLIALLSYHFLLFLMNYYLAYLYR